ncbi:hypothetical protein HPB48_010682 [Haemaphysalis longicornis]|uniref:Uncharacterized protein n=1 Tax=Haemaphysalis longicornis TaxID=44386 RepID=A0A9J6G3U9_HAELO|nr:hypothetical protein HPB48_010682 [Haemaphysalis longicornis]
MTVQQATVRRRVAAKQPVVLLLLATSPNRKNRVWDAVGIPIAGYVSGRAKSKYFPWLLVCLCSVGFFCGAFRGSPRRIQRSHFFCFEPLIPPPGPRANPARPPLMFVPSERVANTLGERPKGVNPSGELPRARLFFGAWSQMDPRDRRGPRGVVDAFSRRIAYDHSDAYLGLVPASRPLDHGDCCRDERARLGGDVVADEETGNSVAHLLSRKGQRQKRRLYTWLAGLLLRSKGFESLQKLCTLVRSYNAPHVATGNRWNRGLLSPRAELARAPVYDAHNHAALFHQPPSRIAAWPTAADSARAGRGPNIVPGRAHIRHRGSLQPVHADRCIAGLTSGEREPETLPVPAF